MGGCCSKRPWLRIIIVGLDGSGKTLIYRRLTRQKTPLETTVYEPTVSFNHCKKCEIGSRNFTIMDLGGNATARNFWKYHLTSSLSCLVFVVDAHDRDRLGEAKDALEKILHEQSLLSSVPLLVIGNKCDFEDCATYTDIVQALALNTLEPHEWTLKLASAATGQGVPELVEWLQKTL